MVFKQQMEVIGMAKLTFAIEIRAVNDSNGNPRRGWIVLDKSGTKLGFVDHAYRGWGALKRAYPDVVELYSVDVKPSVYREELRDAERNGRLF